MIRPQGVRRSMVGDRRLHREVRNMGGELCKIAVHVIGDGGYERPIAPMALRGCEARAINPNVAGLNGERIKLARHETHRLVAEVRGDDAVSYTHLTLPTSDLV